MNSTILRHIANILASAVLMITTHTAVAQDYVAAFYWYGKAAGQGDVDAMTNIALYYYLGRGVAKDITMAIYWWRTAADQGNDKASFNLGICYRDGMGVTRDLYEAKMWLKKAKRLNHPDASIALEEIRMRYGV